MWAVFGQSVLFKAWRTSYGEIRLIMIVLDEELMAKITSSSTMCAFAKFYSRPFLGWIPSWTCLINFIGMLCCGINYHLWRLEECVLFCSPKTIALLSGWCLFIKLLHVIKLVAPLRCRKLCCVRIPEHVWCQSLPPQLARPASVSRLNTALLHDPHIG